MIRILLYILIVTLYISEIIAQTYYVDFESGSDSSDGLTTSTAWKHAPGDENATDIPAAVVLGSGAIVMFKGGIAYHSTITMKHGGSPGSCITYKGDGWGTEKAIIDGTDVLETDWTACQSAEEIFENPNWQNIHYTAYTGEISPFNQIFENGDRAYIAQTPNMTDPFWDDRINEYFTILNGNITRTSLIDDIFLTQSTSNYWNGAYIQIWVRPNIISIQKVNAFDPASRTIYFDSLSSSAIYGDRDQYYSMVNHVSAIDRPGEYVIDENNKEIYYWPYGNINDCILSVSKRNYGIAINGCSNICIEGFKIQGNTSDGAARAIWNNRTWGESAQNIIIKNNEITYIRTRDGRKGAITLSNVDGAIIENNNIHDCQRNSGILIGAKNVTIRNNRINKIGYKGIWAMGSEQLQILNNTILECEGTHGNPISIFTTTNSLTANNFLQSTGEVYTFEDNVNTIVHNNIFLGILNGGEETGTNIIRKNADASDYQGYQGYTIITNNTLLYSNTNNAIAISYFDDYSKVILKNNISDGGPGHESSMSMSRANNLYTGLSWSQKERYGWNLMDDEFIQTELDSIFISPAGLDFRLKDSSCAINAGLNPEIVIPEEIKALFPEYNFSLDYYGNPRGTDGYFDIGALEYRDPNETDNQNNNLHVFALSQNYPNPFNPTTTIPYSLPATGHLSLTIYDMLGRDVRMLVNEVQSAGIHYIQWDGKNANGQTVCSGIYYYRLKTRDDHIKTKKMMLLR